MSLDSMQFESSSVAGKDGAAVQADPSAVPLCVDLDGTLVKSDTLVDTVIVLARQSPASVLQFPQWISQGKASFKKKVSALAAIDVVHLPYNRPLLEYLRQQFAGGREIYLATGADTVLAERVAAHLASSPGCWLRTGASI